MKVADYVLDSLANEGITDIFVVYGAANGDLIDAFTRNKKTRYIAVMHEQAGGFAAEGYAKISGKPGAVIVTSGPGGQNLVTPIGNCYYDSVPCIFITGQVNSKFIRLNEDVRQVGFQETPIVEIVKPVTKYAKLITNASDIRYEVEKAIHLCKEGRPGPVLLDIPTDIQKIDVDIDKLRSYHSENKSVKFDIKKINEQVCQYIADLKESKRPVILVGGGVRISGAIQQLLELGNKLNIPMFPTWNALDVVTSDLNYYGGRVGTYGGAGRNFGLQNSDLFLGIGTRVSGRITGGKLDTFLRGAKKYIVDIDEPLTKKENQQIPFDESIHCDAKIFLDILINKLKEENIPSFSQWMNKVLEWKIKYDPVKKEYFDKKDHVHPYAFMRILSEEAGKKDILVGDCGGNIVTMNHAFESKQGQRMISNNGNSPMGFSFAGAMGAWLASNKLSNVICIIGDGGFNMNIQELQTVKNYNMNFKTFILNNQIYGITKSYQETNFQGRCEACGPKGYSPPNFLEICKAYGIKTVQIKNNSEARAKIREILDSEEPVVCEVVMPEEHSYEPRIFGWKTPIEDMYPYLSREEFKSNMIISPVDGWEDTILPGK
jgi:acetolactate synthase-1/2/3 large subunit